MVTKSLTSGKIAALIDDLDIEVVDVTPVRSRVKATGTIYVDEGVRERDVIVGEDVGRVALIVAQGADLVQRAAAQPQSKHPSII